MKIDKIEKVLDLECRDYEGQVFNWRKDAPDRLSLLHPKSTIRRLRKWIERELEELPGEVRETLPYNLSSGHPVYGMTEVEVGVRPGKVVRRLLPNEWHRVMVEAARFIGWLKVAASDPTLRRLLLGTQSPVGRGSPRTIVDLWATVRRWPSPGGFARRIWAIRRRADRILSPMGLNASWAAVWTAAAYGRRAVNKAAVQAAAATVSGNLACYRRSREVLADPAGEWHSTPGVLATNRQRIRRAIGLRPPIPWCGEDLSRAAEAAGDQAPRIRRTWGRVRKACGEEVTEHVLVALSQLYAALGKDAQRVLDWAFAQPDPAGAIHDYGVDMSPNLEAEAKDWLLRRWIGHPGWPEAVRAASAWSYLRDQGWDPEKKGSLEKAAILLGSRVYSGAKDHAFALEAARWAIDPEDYRAHEARWIKAQKGLNHQTVPAPGGVQGLFKGELRLYQLSKDDPRALYVGHHTGCCQHPGGVGAECAWHSVESPDGAVWVVEVHGRILAQAWAWRYGDVLILDNVEGLGHERWEAEIRALYEAAARGVVGRLGIKEVYVGTRLSDIRWYKETTRREFPAPTRYSDAEYMWRLA